MTSNPVILHADNLIAGYLPGINILNGCSMEVRQGELVRVYLVNITEFDLLNSFHLHGNLFRLYRTGTDLQRYEWTETPWEIGRGDGEGRRREVRRVDFGLGAIVRRGDCDAAATGADVEHAIAGLERAPRLEPALEDLGERRSRDEHALVHVELEPREPRLVQQVRERLTLLGAAHCER